MEDPGSDRWCNTSVGLCWNQVIELPLSIAGSRAPKHRGTSQVAHFSRTRPCTARPPLKVTAPSNWMCPSSSRRLGAERSHGVSTMCPCDLQMSGAWEDSHIDVPSRLAEHPCHWRSRCKGHLFELRDLGTNKCSAPLAEPVGVAWTNDMTSPSSKNAARPCRCRRSSRC